MRRGIASMALMALAGLYAGPFSGNNMLRVTSRDESRARDPLRLFGSMFPSNAYRARYRKKYGMSVAQAKRAAVKSRNRLNHRSHMKGRP